MNPEERLTELLHDSRWSLPGWPRDQALARIRRAARRQRLNVAAQSAVVAVIVGVTVLAAVPAVMRGDPPTRLLPSHGLRPAGSTWSARYPAALGSRPGAVPCPAVAGLQAPGPGTRAEARAALRSLAAGMVYELPVTDQTVRPTSAGDGGSIAAGLRTVAGRQAVIKRILRAAPTSVRYSGPLRAGVGELAAVRQQVAADCGAWVMRSTWVIVSGVPGPTRSLDAELLFLIWRGHLLLYDIQ